MGLYLCIFENDEDIDGIDIGSYADFNAVRECIARTLENGNVGRKFPTLMLHSDCDGEWTVPECQLLQKEIAEISNQLRSFSPIAFPSRWQADLAKACGIVPRNAYESFLDVDGEFLFERLTKLIDKAIERQLPILFQ